MRKRDKLKNIGQANLMLEQSYLKSKGLIKESYQISDMVDEIHNMPDTSVTSGEALNNILTLLKKLDTSDRKEFVNSHLFDDGKGRKLFRVPRKGGKDVEVPINDEIYNKLLS